MMLSEHKPGRLKGVKLSRYEVYKNSRPKSKNFLFQDNAATPKGERAVSKMCRFELCKFLTPDPSKAPNNTIVIVENVQHKFVIFSCQVKSGILASNGLNLKKVGKANSKNN